MSEPNTHEPTCPDCQGPLDKAISFKARTMLLVCRQCRTMNAPCVCIECGSGNTRTRTMPKAHQPGQGVPLKCHSCGHEWQYTDMLRSESAN